MAEIKIRPIHLSHIAISAIWAAAVVAATYLEVHYVQPFTQLDVFWLVLQNTGIAMFNGYSLGKLKVTPEELQAEAEKPANA